ncbi:uncharacterized protein LOC131889153 isoform X2 [Tigriopus californicus]|nr:uncharacterized protein LOC131889153 isoform X2 [Tigriopus californicus]
MGLNNIEYMVLNTTEIFANSILSNIAAKIDNATNHQLYTVSDLLRMVLLYHLGGAYFDYDVISIRAIPQQFSNFAPMIRAKEKWWLTSCLLRFYQPQNQLLANILKEVPLVIDTAKRGELDFKLVTRVAERFCHLTNSTLGGKYFQCPREFQFHSLTSKSGFMGQGLWWCRLKQLRQFTENHSNFKNLFTIHFNDFKNVFHNNASYLLGLDDLSYIMRSHCPATYNHIRRISY